MTEVIMTPLGIDPQTCSECGEWKGASEGLSDSEHRHLRCVNALRMIQLAAHTSDGDAFKARAVGIADAMIGPLDPDDIAERE